MNKPYLCYLLRLLIPLMLALPALAEPQAVAPPAAAFYQVTRDPAIIHALQALVAAGETESVWHILSKPVRLIIKPLDSFGPVVKKFDALSWMSPEGQQYVFINEKHRFAPPQALAALIGHEMMHDDEENSLTEEVAGWTEEARLWQKLRPQVLTIYFSMKKRLPLIVREETIATEAANGNLVTFVRSNAGYKNLPEHSKGF